MERTGLLLVLAVGILSTSAYGYQSPGRQFLFKTTDKASNFVGKQKQNDFPLNIPDNAYPVQDSHILFPCRQNGLFAHPLDCTLGVSCWGGISQVFTCTDILHFNNVTKVCDSFCSAHCDPLLACPCGWDTCENLSPRENDETGERISYPCRREGLHPSIHYCNRYYECSHGELALRTCPPGLHFNIMTSRCETPCKAKCDTGIPCPRERAGSLSTETSVAERFTSSQSTKKVFRLKTAFTCSEDGLFPNPKDCSKYINCSDGIAYDLSCPPGRHFNKKTKECETFCSAKCAPNLDCNWRNSMGHYEGLEENICNNTDETYYSSLLFQCRAYYKCEGSELNKFRCLDGQHFSKETSRCEEPCVARCDASLAEECGFEISTESTIKVLQMFCSGRKTFGYRHSHECEYYFKCEDGEISVVRCSDGYHLNKKTLQCEEPCVARCDSSLAEECGWGNETAGTEIAPTQRAPIEDNETGDFDEEMPGVVFTCQDGDFYPDHKNCNIFYECSHGRIIIHLCFPGYHFNKRTKRCDKPCNAKCDPTISCTQKRTQSVTAETLAAEDFTSPVSTQSSKKVFNLKVTFVCFEDGLFPNRRDCSKYVNCSNGNAYELSCPPSRHFNNVTKQCETFCSAKCDPNLICNWRDTRWKFEEGYEDICNHTDENFFQASMIYCDIYYKCEAFEFNKFRCPNGQHFNDESKRCEEPCDARCDVFTLARKCGWKDKPKYDLRSKIARLCSRGDKYGMQNRFTCNTYLKCNGTHVTGHRCPDGQHYNPKTYRCDDPCNVRCKADLAEECGWENFTGIDFASPGTLTTQEPNVTLTPLKSSKELCSKDGIYLERNPLDCKTYFKCMDGDADLIYCPDGEHFNQKTLQCEDACDAQCDPTMVEVCRWRYTIESDTNLFYSLKQPVFDFECPADGLYPNNACENFIQCLGGQAYLNDCPRGLHYEPSSQKCTTPCKARCDSYYEMYCEDEEKERAPKQILKDFDCMTDGYHVNPLDCGSFIQCFNGIAYTIYCPTDLHYSPTLEICMSPCDAKCAPNYEEHCRAEEWNRRKKLQHTHKSSAKQPFPLVSEYICENDGDYPNPEDCNSYILCSLGESYYKDCPEGLHFSATTQRCESPCEARCQSSLACECDWDTCEIQEVSDEVECEVEFDEGTCNGRIPRYAYDIWSGRCRGFLYGGCGGNSNNFRTMEECQNKCQKKLLKGFRCPEDNGMFGHYPDCLSYYHCKRGVPTLKKCPKGKAFDHKKSKCVKEHEATCVYECRDKDAVYPYEEDCRKYIDCVNGIPKLERCTAGNAFDPEEKDCINERQVETCFWQTHEITI